MQIHASVTVRYPTPASHPEGKAGIGGRPQRMYGHLRNLRLNGCFQDEGRALASDGGTRSNTNPMGVRILAP
jgi:hypothetical protein